tara:strand:+ start:62 stop:589 length:528 start_codon:yes stop_codon:yes gene_type:complete
MLRKLILTLNIIWVLFGTWLLFDEFDSDRFIFQFLILLTVPILTLWYLLGNLKFIEIFKQGAKTSRKGARDLTIAINVLGALVWGFALISLIMDGELGNDGTWLFVIFALTPILTLWYLLSNPTSKIEDQLGIWLRENISGKDLLVFTIKGLIVCGLVMLTIHLMAEWNLYIDIE